ncbi:MAG: hypothetical protein DI538_19595 [Azospira oryzae]|jgi:hypothetical protein|nr:MAG: hypothetical protein DI538_19595 [Azospira oryzae]
MRIAILLVLTLVFSSFSVFAQKKLVFTDQAYEEQIKTIMLYPASEAARANLQPAAVPFQKQNLLLEFDDIQDSRNNYSAKLIHCTYNWTKSTLMDLDFMSEYNEITLDDYENSSSLFLPYVHYRFEVPRVKIPGNYLLIIYRDGDKEDLILSKRMMVYDPRAGLMQDNQLLGNGALQATNQQINFTVSYQGLQVLNPMEMIHVVIRQNQRWDNARMDVKPSFIREDVSQLEYRFFDQDKQFSAGNEFRFVDFRSLNFPGQNTGTLNRSTKPFELYVQPEKSREGLAYAQYKDLNGRYAIENTDYQDGYVSGNYIFVNFQLTTRQVNGEVYVNGALNNWQRNDDNRMTYNPAKSAYEARMLLKQGWYNYEYWTESKTLPGNYLEGSHFETENIYDVLVYYKSLQPNADLLIGYFSIAVNPR